MGKVVKIFIFFLSIWGVLALSACGRVSEPSPYEGSGYPHSYPQH